MVMWSMSRLRNVFFKSSPETTEKKQGSTNDKDKVSDLSEHDLQPDAETTKRINECIRIGPQANINTVKQVSSLVGGLLLQASDPEKKINAVKKFKTYYLFDLSKNERNKLDAHVIQFGQTGEYLFFGDVVKDLKIKDAAEDKQIQFFFQFLFNYWNSKGRIFLKTDDGERFKGKIDMEGAEWVISEFAVRDNETAQTKLLDLKNKLSQFEELKIYHGFISSIIKGLEKYEDSNYRSWFSEVMLTYIYLQSIKHPETNKSKLLRMIYSEIIAGCGIANGPVNEPHFYRSTSKPSKAKQANSAAAASSSSSSSRQRAIDRQLRDLEFEDDYFGRLHMFP